MQTRQYARGGEARRDEQPDLGRSTSSLRALLEDILPSISRFEDDDVDVELPELGRDVFVLNGRRLNLERRTGVSDFNAVASDVGIMELLSE